jgi:S1-C subfamily serine protease
VTVVDWIIVVVVVLFGAFGFGQGFVVGALSLAGFAAGAIGGSRLGPLLLAEGAESPYAPLFALGGAILVGAVLAGVLEAVGHGLRGRIRIPGLGVLDGLLGAVLSGAIALGLAWLAGAVALQTPGARELRSEIQRSSILRALNETLPPSGPVLNALARFDPLPQVTGPQADVDPPPAGVAEAEGIRRAAASVVRVQGTACGLGVGGSGWIAGPGTVVTNAHVVAGQRDTEIQVAGRPPSLPARAVAFDARNDVAVLRVDGLDAPALSFSGETASGTPGAVLGFPLNGPFDVRGARLGSTAMVVTQDAYGRGPVQRQVTVLRGRVRSGNSGGPVVSRGGRVLGTVFAAATGGGPSTGYAVPNAIVRRSLETASADTVSTGPCVP